MKPAFAGSGNSGSSVGIISPSVKSGSSSTGSSSSSKVTKEQEDEGLSFKNTIASAHNRVKAKNMSLDSDAASFYNYVISSDPPELARGFQNVKELFTSLGKPAPNNYAIRNYFSDLIEKGSNIPLDRSFGNLSYGTNLTAKDIISSFENRRISGSAADYYAYYGGRED